MLTRRDIVGGLAFSAGLATWSGRGLGQAEAEPFKVVAFAGASNWPFWVGQEKGFFRREGVEVVLELTPNSVELAKNLHAGRYDLALTSVDNVVAYDEG
jgi:ABC-type nitrate/sulfonate/bicarbonate transport system substrate-binding protein